MMKVYICPQCGWLRMVSRRRDVECHKCGVSQMTLTNLDLEQFTDMSEEERENYSKGWQYIHGKRDN